MHVAIPNAAASAVALASDLLIGQSSDHLTEMG
jgi:hypothetical protein